MNFLLLKTNVQEDPAEFDLLNQIQAELNQAMFYHPKLDANL